MCEAARSPLGDVSNKENISTRTSKCADRRGDVSSLEQVSCCCVYRLATLQLLNYVQMDVDEGTAIARVKEIDCDEPLLQENPRRFVVFPIKHSDVWQFYKKAEGMLVSHKPATLLWLTTDSGSVGQWEVYCFSPYSGSFIISHHGVVSYPDLGLVNFVTWYIVHSYVQGTINCGQDTGFGSGVLNSI